MSKTKSGMSQLAKDIWFYILVTILTLAMIVALIWAVVVGRLDIAGIIVALTPLVQYLFGLLRNTKNGRRFNDETGNRS
jgi:hypothetical protein